MLTAEKQSSPFCDVLIQHIIGCEYNINLTLLQCEVMGTLSQEKLICLMLFPKIKYGTSKVNQMDSSHSKMLSVMPSYVATTLFLTMPRIVKHSAVFVMLLCSPICL